jgi:hypothetical protein
MYIIDKFNAKTNSIYFFYNSYAFVKKKNYIVERKYYKQLIVITSIIIWIVHLITCSMKIDNAVSSQTLNALVKHHCNF